MRTRINGHYPLGAVSGRQRIRAARINTDGHNPLNFRMSWNWSQDVQLPAMKSAGAENLKRTGHHLKSPDTRENIGKLPHFR